MADFVAVIRRAVDGLSDNSPEMRAKVYEKARGAVLRQLESMKPRPPEEMLRRQLDKLEAAIVEVESEHAEALPAAEEPEIAEADVLSAGPVDDGHPADEAVHEPVRPDDDAYPASPTEEQASPAWAQPQDSYEPVADQSDDRWHEDEPAQTAMAPVAAEPVEPEAPEAAPAPGAAPYLFGDESWAGEDETAEQTRAHDEPAQAERYDEPVEAEPYHEPVEAEPYHEPVQPEHYEEPAQPLPSEPEPAAYYEPAVEAEPVHDDRAEPVYESYVQAEPLDPVRDDHAHAQPPEAGEANYESTDHADYEDVRAEDHEPVVRDIAPAPDPRVTVEDHEVPADFPVEEPTSRYSRIDEAEHAADLPAAPTDWPREGLASSATGSVQLAKWRGKATFAAPADAATEEAADAALPAEGVQESIATPDDPFAWHEENLPVDVAGEPAEFVEVATVQGELAAAAQDLYDEPVMRAEAEYEQAAAAIAEPPLDDLHVRSDQDRLEPQLASFDQPEEPRRQEPAAESDWDDSPFTDVPLPSDDTDRRDSKARDDQQWDEFQEFAAYADGNGIEQDLAQDDYVPAATDKPARSYRIQQRRRIDFTSIGLGLLGLALVAGSGYGAWVFRDTLSGLVTGLVSTPPAEAPKPAATETPADPAAGNAEPADAGAGENTAAATPDPAPAEPELQKFTQRLQPDGSEVDEGVAEGSDTSGEGRSVAPQTVASSEPVDATTQPPAGSTASAAPAAIPVGVSQKMFLYEERVGQTSPVAVEGAVVWSLKHEKAENGRDEAIVQAQVTAPERGLSALVSFKRNLDPSLPASHLVELVFSLPKEFEGGAIESVQRVALKQTEQDRGDPLIAVPAKITDDFHMIALNDYADAREFNLRLMETRDWIDIPVTYRNGRRALITMEKGSTGAEAFNQAIREWRLADPSASAVPANPPAAPAPAAPAPAAPAQAPAPAAPAANPQ